MDLYQKHFEQSIGHPEAYWKEQSDLIPWFLPPKEILTRDENGLYRWYKGGKLNTCYLAVDYHVDQGRGQEDAIVYDSPVTDTVKRYTYKQLLVEVEKVAGMLHRMGVDKGDRVVIYMPMIPETVFAMLACARIGAVHSVVFGGFSAHELAIRIDDATPKVLLTASNGIEGSRIIPYKPIVDRALEEAQHAVAHVVLLQRPQLTAPLMEGRDIDWDELRASSPRAGYISVDAHDPLYVIYTSGTTGTPKGVVRDHGGHAVAMMYSMKYIYNVDAGDVFWAASDVGWVVGHSYIVYAPLIRGCTTVLFEGKPVRTPDAGTFWRVIDDHRVNVLFTAPTAFRAIRKEDPNAKLKKARDTSSLKYLFLAGERCDHSTLHWLEEILEIPVIDHWWQTESGWPMIANMAGLGLKPVKAGSAGHSVCGFDSRILDQNGVELGPYEEGALAIRFPLAPGTFPNLWNDTARFRQSYMSRFPGWFFSGDGAYQDEEGYFYITGRMDDIINVAGHRLSTAEMEEVVSSHPAIAECAVIGIEDPMKGQVPLGLVVTKEGETITDDQLEKELVQMVRDKIGPVGCFKKALVTERLPKTRSGKILRKTMRMIADGKSYTCPSTIEDPSVLPEIEKLMEDVLLVV